MTVSYREVDLDSIVERLREVLEKRGDVLIAVVFGSAVRRRLVRDLDVAVFFRGQPSLRQVLGLAAELEEAVKIPVDLMPLNLAPPGVVLKALVSGRPVLVRDRALLARLLHRALGERMDLEIKLRIYGNRGKQA